MSSKLIRSKLYKLAAERAEMSVAEVSWAVDAFLEEVKIALLQGKRVELRRFGSFWPSVWKGRRVVTPDELNVIRAQTSRTVHFYAGKELRAIRGRQPA